MSRALIVVDMINTYDHPDGEQCARSAREALPAMREAIGRAREDDGTSLIYVNDHYDLWTSDRQRLIERVLDDVPDRELVEPILPERDDEMILKARHSIFYETSLAYLLRQREIEHLTLVGQVTEQCILYSALDAHVRHFEVAVVKDALVAIDDELGNAALRMMERNMRAELL